MGYSTSFEGQIEFSRELTIREYRTLTKMNQSPEYCEQFTDTPDTIPASYMQWASNEDGTALVWDGGEKFYDYIHWLRWLVKHFFKPNGIVLNGTIKWQGEEIGDLGVITVVENKVTSRKMELKGLVKCPECAHEFLPNEN